jgi:hypothetical protein
MRASLKLWTDTWQLGLDAQRVIALRLARISAGGAAADAECRRMVSEKIAAAAASQAAAAADRGVGRPCSGKAGGSRKSSAIVWCQPDRYVCVAPAPAAAGRVSPTPPKGRSYGSALSPTLLVCLAVLCGRPPRCEILFVIIDPTRGAGQEFGQPSASTAIGAVLAMVGYRFATTWRAVIGSAEDTSPKRRERKTHFALLVRRRAGRD